MPGPVRIAVMGAGLIGRRHIEHIVASPQTTLAAIVDPGPAGPAAAAAAGAPYFADLATLFATDRPDGVVVATPNGLHVANGLACIAEGVPVLVEKPLADDVAGAQRLVQAARAAGVPLLTGHHRRHNPLMTQARAILAEGCIGTLVSVHAFCWFAKPASYFATEWRRQPGAGPVLLNLIHDVDNLRFLCGEIASVQAFESRALRGNAIEETSVIALRFVSGVLATLNVSDAIAAPWSWEMTSGENADFSRQNASCYFFGGTKGALTVPDLTVTTHVGPPDWMTPMQSARVVPASANPLRAQIEQFASVIRGEQPPLVSGQDGLDTLRVIAAIKEASASGAQVMVRTGDAAPG